MNSSKNIKIGALLSYVAIAFSIIAGLLYTPWMVQQIGKSDYGLYALVSSFLTYFLMDFGLGQSIARFISMYRNESDEAKANDLLGLATKLYLAIDILIFVVLGVVFLFIENIFLELSPEEIHKFKTVYLIFGFFSLLSFPFSSLNGILIAYERFVILKVTEVISKIAVIVLMVVALLLGYKLFALVAINAFVGLLIIAVKIFYLVKTTHLKINLSYQSKKLLRQITGFSVWVTITGIAQRFLIYITPTILAIFSGTEQIAYFSIAMTLEAYTWTFASALNGLFLPKVSQLIFQNKDPNEINNLMIKVGRIQLLIVGLLIVGLISLGKEFVILWMGNEFELSYYIMLFLILPGIVNLTQDIAGTMLFVVNELKYRAILFTIASIISVGLSVILVPIYGGVGSAIGIFTALFLCQVIGMNIVYYKILKLDVPRFFRETHLKLLPPITLSMALGFLTQFYFPVSSFLYFIPKAILIGIIYVFLMWYSGMNTEEKYLIRNIIGRIIPKLYK